MNNSFTFSHPSQFSAFDTALYNMRINFSQIYPSYFFRYAIDKIKKYTYTLISTRNWFTKVPSS